MKNDRPRGDPFLPLCRERQAYIFGCDFCRQKFVITLLTKHIIIYLQAMSWTREEILKLNEYEYLRHCLLCTLPKELLLDHEKDFIKLYQLEAELITLNKYVVTYVNGEINQVLTFSEALEEEQRYIEAGKILTMHSVSVKSYREQQRITYA